MSHLVTEKREKPPKHWLIQPTVQDSEPGSYSSRWMTYVTLGKGIALSCISLLVATGVFLPTVATAGVFSTFFLSLAGSFREAGGIGGGYQQNVQTMTLPQAAMNIDPTPSLGGGDITIVGGTAVASVEGPAGTRADIEESSSQSHQISVYVVRDGDTLSGIATLFDVSVNTIRWSNDIGPSGTIHPGQTLTILPINGVRHTVEKGDTLASIAEDYNGHLDEIVSYNGITADAALAVGTEIIIPDGELGTARASTSSSSSTSIARAATGPTYSGYYLRPVNGGVRTQGLHGYNGIDIAADVGTPVLAAAAGEVIISKNSGWNGGYGNYVVIRHDNGTQTLYAHNTNNIVSVGQYVVQGQVIAYMGSTGRSTGSHVHFEVRGATNPF